MVREREMVEEKERGREMVREREMVEEKERGRQLSRRNAAFLFYTHQTPVSTPSAAHGSVFGVGEEGDEYSTFGTRCVRGGACRHAERRRRERESGRAHV